MRLKYITEKIFVEFPGIEIIGIFSGLTSLLLFLYNPNPIFVIFSGICFMLGFVIGISIFLVYNILTKSFLFLVNHFIYSFVNFFLWFSLRTVLNPQEKMVYILSSPAEYFVIATFFFMIYMFLEDFFRTTQRRNTENFKKNLKKMTILSSFLLYFAGFTHSWFSTFTTFPEKIFILLTNFLVILSIVQTLGVVAVLMGFEFFNRRGASRATGKRP